MWAGFQGLRVSPKARPSVNGHCPSSGLLVLPTTTAPAARSLRTASASAVLTGKSPAQPNAVGSPHTSVSSLTATGTPSSGRPRPCSRARSAASASASAASARTRRKAFSVGCVASIRASARSVSAREVVSPAARAAAAARASPGSGPGTPSPVPRAGPGCWGRGCGCSADPVPVPVDMDTSRAARRSSVTPAPTVPDPHPVLNPSVTKRARHPPRRSATATATAGSRDGTLGSDGPVHLSNLRGWGCAGGELRPCAVPRPRPRCC